MNISIKSICLNQDDSIVEAMKVIEKSKRKIAIVIASDGKLLGTITDGDIRRGLIKNISINDPVHMIMNRNPVSFSEKESPETIERIMSSKNISHIPVLDSAGRVIDLLMGKSLKGLQKKSNTVVLMAGGLGTRLGELTADYPKPMLKVRGKPILEIVLQNLKDHGFENFIIAVKFKAEVIEDYFKDGSLFGVKIKYVKEKERMGTCGALSLINFENDLPLIVMNGDVLTKVDFSQFLENHVNNDYMASICVRNYDFQVPFGVVQVEGQIVTQIEEKPTQKFLVNAGVYAFNQDVLKLIPRDSYFDMPELINKILTKHNQRAGVFPIHEYWMDVGRRDDFNQAQNDFKKVF